MAGKGFFRTVKAFSCAAAIFAGTLGAALFGALFASCENMGGDVSAPALFTQRPAGVSAAGRPLGMGSVTGKISQSPASSNSGASIDSSLSNAAASSNSADLGVSQSVVPTLDEVTGSIVSYTVSAWGTKADGTVVPETSPITVDTATTTFSIGLEYGTWTLRADAKDSSGNIIMRHTAADPITLDDTSPVVSMNFALDYAQIAGTTGGFSLAMAYDTSVKKISYSLTNSGGSVVANGDVDPAPASSFTLDSSIKPALGALAPGDYQLVVEFKADDGSLLTRMDQVVQIYSNITTNKIDGTAPYINTSGGGAAINVSSDVIKKYQQSVVYVGGTGLNTGTAASDANNGTQFDPVEHLERALEIINASVFTSADVPDGFKIFVQDNISLTQNIAPPSSKKIKIIGTNQSAPWTISGAYSDAATFSITTSGDFSCSYIVFDKINGFEISAGQATLNNCKITNGKAPAGKEGGGGLYISGSSAKATLESCTISGCEASYGGAIYAAGEVELKDCLIGAEASEAAQEAAGKYSNKANGGGGIYVSGTGKLSVNGNNKISYNYATGYGGGLNYAGTAQIDLAGVKIECNYAKTGGGGIYLADSRTAAIDSCVVKGNVTKQDGGGLMLSKNSTATISGSEISYNTAEYYGFGGGANVQGKATFTNTNISYNKSLCVNNDKYGGTGGGIYIDTTNSTTLMDKTAEIQNCKITNNQASNNATGIGGAQGGSGGGVAIISGDCLISGDDTDISANQAQYNGGGLYARENSVTFNFSGGTISGNTAAKGGAVYNNGSLLMGGSAYIPAGTDKKNDVCLATGRTVSVASSLTATPTPVATITPPAYSPGTAVLSDTGTGASAGALVQSELSKFAVVPHSGDEWTIGYNSSTKRGVLATANIYVDGSATGEGAGTAADPYPTVAKALTNVLAPNCNIILLGDTTETVALNITAAMTGLTIGPAAGDTAPKTITSSNNKSIGVEATATFNNLIFSGWSGMSAYADNIKMDYVTFQDCHNESGAASSGGAIWLGGGSISATSLTIDNCYVTGSSATAGGIYVADGASLSVDGLVLQNCHADDAGSDGGGIYNAGTVSLRLAKIVGCSAARYGAGICNANGATLILDNDCYIDSQIYLTGGIPSYPAKPIYVKAYFGLAIGAPKIPVAVEERSGADKQFQEGDAVVQGWDTYDIKEAQVNCFATSGTALSLEYDGTASPHCGKLVDKSIAGGVTVNLGANILFEIGTPSASGEKARFNVIDNSSGTPTYVTPTSAQIKILQYGTPVYSADAQEVTATYLAEGEYELYCKAVIGGVAYDTTVSFAAGGKYIPLTLEAAAAGAVVTFSNKADGKVKYRVNGGAEHEIESNDSAAITLNAVGDKVQFFGDNAKYGYVSDSGIVDATKCSNISCSDECYVYGNIMSLVDSAGYASAKALAGENTFARLFGNNTKIKNKTNYNILLPATTLKSCCYHSLFLGCAGLTAAPELPATTMEYYCYGEMFSGCTNLAAAPELPATTLAKDCYERMFKNCKSLTTAPELPATSLAEFCYPYMFNGCAGLTAAPALPATTVTEGCYQGMFLDCTSLTTAPELPAATPIWFCYCDMFSGCTNLATAPALPATTLDTGCYSGMFKNCTKLTAAPALPATTLAKQCYQEMFKGCTMLNSVTCLATDISAVNCTYNWLYGVASTGVFTKAAGMGVDTSGGWTSNSASGIPTGWVVVDEVIGSEYTTATPLTLEAAADGASVTFKNKSDGPVIYRVNGGAAQIIARNASLIIILSAVGDKVQFYGNNSRYGTVDSSESSSISCLRDCYVYGNIMSLVKSTGFASENNIYSSFGYTFAYLFYNNDYIKSKTGSVFFLPATTLAGHCYTGMFYGCTGLTTAPELPATTLANDCYNDMFYGCTGLASAPALPATTLADSCYKRMFKGCTKLTATPELPAPILTEYCYLEMFNGCSGINRVTCLATDISANGCTLSWLNGVKSTGVFYKAASMGVDTSGGWISYGSTGIPITWTVEDYVAP